ncbi:MAG: OmpA family protein [Lentisphaerae bacterium]|nr:OmpA family protein [Lentisphaerota bacterium]
MLSLIALLAIGICGTGCKRASKFGKKPSDDTLNISTKDPSGGIPLSERTGDYELVPDVSFEAALFDYDSAQLKESEGAKLSAVADYLNNTPNVGAILEGNCDERGSNEYNMSLGERRSLAVRAYLVGLGVDAALLQTKSNGEEKPADPGHDDAAWSKNRRVEFVIIKQ